MANENKAWEAVIRVPEPEIDYSRAALIVIDLQNSFARRDCGLFVRLREIGLADEAEYAISRIEQVVVPNVNRLVRAFRARSAPIVFARSASVRGDGSDQTARHRAQGLVCAEWSHEAQILSELEVVPGDVVLTKSGSGCFTSTNLSHMLRNMGVQTVVLTGMWTNSCVETTARHAGDLDYNVVLVEDACVAMSPENHAWALRYLGDNFALLRSTEQVLAATAEEPQPVPVGP
ncbi:MAG: biuret amidohydrolase [Thermoleophilaceae bacterium]|jgi:nicotinamidase-related amidase|nr:biuret amidohydrolase [Thermoleophilaceae bacterium]